MTLQTDLFSRHAMRQCAWRVNGQERVHTVAVSVPGTRLRVMVDMLAGTPAELHAAAIAQVREVAAQPTRLLLTRVIATGDITHLDPSTQQDET